MKKENAYRLLAVAGVLAIALGALSIAQTARADRYRTQLSAVYEKACYESAELMENILVALEKLTISDSPEQGQTLLDEISRKADTVQDNLGVLPFAHETVTDTMKFLNQVGDYARTLSEGLARGTPLSDTDQDQIYALSRECATLTERIQQLVDLVESSPRGAAPVWENMEQKPADAPEGVQLRDPGVNYPSLIYDGPFSDGKQDGNLRGLGDHYIDQKRAEELALEYAGVPSGSRFIGEAIAPTPGWEYEVDIPGGSVTMLISRQGGRVIYMMPTSGSTGGERNLQELTQAASVYLSARGYGEMRPNYWQVYDGRVVINFAAVQDGVLLYPDLVKVQVNTGSARVEGLEAVNYFSNHLPRSLSTPELSMEQAQAHVSDKLTITASQLCVIPRPGKELLCYEFQGKVGESTYLVYVDANTGEEVQIFKIIDSADGKLAL